MTTTTICIAAILWILGCVFGFIQYKKDFPNMHTEEGGVESAAGEWTNGAAIVGLLCSLFFWWMILLRKLEPWLTRFLDKKSKL
jgi:hypothetical protein